MGEKRKQASKQASSGGVVIIGWGTHTIQSANYIYLIILLYLFFYTNEERTRRPMNETDRQTNQKFCLLYINHPVWNGTNRKTYYKRLVSWLAAFITHNKQRSEVSGWGFAHNQPYTIDNDKILPLTGLVCISYQQIV